MSPRPVAGLTAWGRGVKVLGRAAGASNVGLDPTGPERRLAAGRGLWAL